MPDHPDEYHLDHLLIGEGDEICLAFHGFGQEPEVMKYLSEPPEFHFKVISIALHYHGNSSAPDAKKAILSEEFNLQIEKILALYQVKTFYLAGFSIGARLALSILPYFSDRIKGLWLFAPDGLPVSTSYKIATQNVLGNAVFKWLLRYGFALRILLMKGRFFRLIDKKTAAYFQNELKTKVLRNRIFNTWMLYRDLIPDMQAIKTAMDTHLIPLKIISGKYDKVIPPSSISKYLKKNAIPAEIIIIPHGHNLMSSKAFRRLGDFVQERVGAY